MQLRLLVGPAPRSLRRRTVQPLPALLLQPAARCPRSSTRFRHRSDRGEAPPHRRSETTSCAATSSALSRFAGFRDSITLRRREEATRATARHPSTAVLQKEWGTSQHSEPHRPSRGRWPTCHLSLRRSSAPECRREVLRSCSGPLHVPTMRGSPPRPMWAHETTSSAAPPRRVDGSTAYQPTALWPAHHPSEQHGQSGVQDGRLGALSQLGQPCKGGVPGELVEHRLAAVVGTPAAEARDGLAVELDRPRGLGGGCLGASRNHWRSTRAALEDEGCSSSARCALLAVNAESLVCAGRPPGAAGLDAHRLSRHLRGAKPESAVQSGNTAGRR
ncbi:hypothetical protein JD79_02865 [Geodermatophilus normandii]|uniref:Uncharacterized protein n=1 Tax=Geodermatophilus normandii TaxID=1137989 RepID=A0A317QPX9_9ACTN|nr:hypothetical protein JD79_02865 [Geodermatophilus normandii]